MSPLLGNNLLACLSGGSAFAGVPRDKIGVVRRDRAGRGGVGQRAVRDGDVSNMPRRVIPALTRADEHVGFREVGDVRADDRGLLSVMVCQELL